MIRRFLNHDESMSDDIRPFAFMFLNDIVGVVLRKRGTNDDFICFEVISEDDAYWFPYTGNGSSSYWLDNYIAVLQSAKDWCDKKAIEDQWGYTFKEGTQERRSDDPFWRRTHG